MASIESNFRTSARKQQATDNKLYIWNTTKHDHEHILICIHSRTFCTQSSLNSSGQTFPSLCIMACMWPVPGCQSSAYSGVESNVSSIQLWLLCMFPIAETWHAKTTFVIMSHRNGARQHKSHKSRVRPQERGYWWRRFRSPHIEGTVEQHHPANTPEWANPPKKSCDRALYLEPSSCLSLFNRDIKFNLGFNHT